MTSVRILLWSPPRTPESNFVEIFVRKLMLYRIRILALVGIFRWIQALVLAMRTSTRREGNLIVSVKNCDTSHNDEMLFNSAAATGEYTLDLQV